MRRSLTILAPAKLNLALSVGPPDATGMHPIASWMVTVNLFDELNLTRLEDDRLSRYAILWHADAKRRSEINWSITKDLAVRAHLTLQDQIGRNLPIQLKLEKRIPVGGGLGGGSSNAASMLNALNELFELGLSGDDLAAIGKTLGSDVPFLIRGGSALVEGRGEVLTHHHPSPIHAVIAFPNAICPTPKVYGLFDEMHVQRNGTSLRTAAVTDLIHHAARGPLPSDQLFNDLAPAAIHAAPQLHDDLKSLAEIAQRPAHVSGSGSSIFVLCDDELHAAALAESVQNKLHLPAVAVRSSYAVQHAAV